jgi:hypothetical protein
MDMTSGGWDSSGEEPVGGREGGTLSDGEGMNKGSLDERRWGSGERDDGEPLVVSNGGSSGLCHTTRMPYAYAQVGTALHIIPSRQLYVLCVCIYVFSPGKTDRRTVRQVDRQGTFRTNQVCTMTTAQVCLGLRGWLNQFGDDLTSVVNRQCQRPRHPSEPGRVPGRPMACPVGTWPLPDAERRITPPPCGPDLGGFAQRSFP